MAAVPSMTLTFDARSQLEMMVKAEDERQRAQARIAGALEMQKEMLRQQRESYHERQARNEEKRAQVRLVIFAS